MAELLVVIAIVAVLAAAVAPLGKGMLARSRAVNCSKNLRQIGLASMMYAGDNHMRLPATSHERGGKSWTLTLQPYASGTITFKCPADSNDLRGFTYVLNDFLTRHPAGADHLNFSILTKIDRPEATFMFAEAAASYPSDHFHFTPYHGGRIPPAVFAYQVSVAVHGEKANYLFADGHMETLSWQETQSRLAADQSRFVEP